MNEFKFDLVSWAVLTLRFGFSGEVETVKAWTADGNASIDRVFIAIPSGPVHVARTGTGLGGSIQIAESNSPKLLAEWVIQQHRLEQPSGLIVRTISIPAGVPYSEYHNISGPYVGMLVETGTDEFVVQAVGIPERAPASMLQDPNPTPVFSLG